MDVDLTLNIIGLGIHRMTWARLCKMINGLLIQEDISAVFAYYQHKALNGYRTFLDGQVQGDPDIIITSFDYFSDLTALEQLVNENRAVDDTGPPHIFLLEKDINRFLDRLLTSQPSVRIDINGLGDIQIKDSRLLLPSASERVEVELTPPPTSVTTIEKSLWDSDLDIAFCALDAVSAVTWENEHYTPAEFISEVVERTGFNKDPNMLRWLMKRGSRISACGGIPLTDLRSINFNYLKIDHVLTDGQMKKQDSDFDHFLNKFRELAKGRSCRAFNAQRRQNTSDIKASTPITVCSDYPVVNDIYYHILIQDGFEVVMTMEQAADQTDRLLVKLVETLDEPSGGPLECNLALAQEIFNIPGFPKVTRKLSSKPPEISSEENEVDIESLRKERKRLVGKLKKLEDQIKSLSGSKILADQEKYMNMLASRKLEILTVLLEMAVTWDDQDDKQKRTYEENVLVFHDDALQASTINSQLEGDGKRLFVDVTSKFSSLRAFVTLNTDILEPYLHDGFIFCFPSSRSILGRKLQEFQGELVERKYPEIAKGLENLKAERTRLQKHLLELAYREAFLVLQASYQQQADLIFKAAGRARDFLASRHFAPESIRRFCLYSTDEKRSQPVRNALTGVFRDMKQASVDSVLLPLTLSTSVPESQIAGLEELAGSEKTKASLLQEALIQNNVTSLSAYLKRAANEISHVTTDLLVLVQDLELLTLLVRTLRQREHRYTELPVLAVCSGILKADRMKELSDAGVLLVYYDPFFTTRDDDLSDQFQALFNR